MTLDEAIKVYENAPELFRLQGDLPWYHSSNIAEQIGLSAIKFNQMIRANRAHLTTLFPIPGAYRLSRNEAIIMLAIAWVDRQEIQRRSMQSE